MEILIKLIIIEMTRKGWGLIGFNSLFVCFSRTVTVFKTITFLLNAILSYMNPSRATAQQILCRRVVVRVLIPTVFELLYSSKRGPFYKLSFF